MSSLGNGVENTTQQVTNSFNQPNVLSQGYHGNGVQDNTEEQDQQYD